MTPALLSAAAGFANGLAVPAQRIVVRDDVRWLSLVYGALFALATLIFGRSVSRQLFLAGAQPCRIAQSGRADPSRRKANRASGQNQTLGARLERPLWGRAEVSSSPCAAAEFPILFTEIFAKNPFRRGHSFTRIPSSRRRVFMDSHLANPALIGAIAALLLRSWLIAELRRWLNAHLTVSDNGDCALHLRAPNSCERFVNAPRKRGPRKIVFRRPCAHPARTGKGESQSVDHRFGFLRHGASRCQSPA